MVLLTTALIVIGAAIVLATSYTWLASPIRVQAARVVFEHMFDARITVGDVTELKVLPRPHVTLSNVTFSAQDGAVAVTMPRLRVRLSLGQLLRGRLKIDRMQAIDAMAVVDLDAVSARQTRAGINNAGADAGVALIPDRLVMTAGQVQLRSARLPGGAVAAEVHADVRGVRGGAVTGTGSLTWHGERGDFSAHLDSLPDFVAGRGTSGFARYKSASVVASANGLLPEGWHGGFTGSLSVSSSNPAALLKSAGLGNYALAGIRHVSFTGAAEANDTGVAIANAKLIVNKTTLEGTLGWQYQAERAGLVGTLATNVLDLDTFVTGMPALMNGKDPWSAETIDFPRILSENIDLRVSANRVTLGGMEVEDAALSALCRDGRLEVSLGEARAYGGLVKARIFTSDLGDVIDLKADASWSQVELDQLPKRTAVGQAQWSGSSSGHVSVAARGPSIAAMIENSEGTGQLSVRQGALSGLPELEAALHPGEPGRKQTSETDEQSFDLAAMDFTIARGILATSGATLTGPDLHALLRGQVSLLDRSFSVSQVPEPAGPSNAGHPATEGEPGTESALSSPALPPEPSRGSAPASDSGP